jgi:hypothetical protein
MTRRRRLVAVVALLLVLSTALAWPLLQSVYLTVSADTRTDAELAGPVATPAFSSDALRALFEADQRERAGEAIDWDRLRVSDARRRVVVRAWLDAGAVTAPLDRFRAAMLFQHGRSIDDYRLAHDLARAAAEGGCREARWLTAATEDRLLLSQGRPQRFGTQYVDVGGAFELAPVDPATTDAERAAWDVPPLAAARAGS